MTNTSVTKLRSNLFDYTSNCIEFNDVINITTKNGNVIMLSEEEYRGMLATIELMSNPEVKNSIIEGINAPREELEEFAWDE